MLTLSIKPASLERRTRPLRGQSSRPALTHVVMLASANPSIAERLLRGDPVDTAIDHPQYTVPLDARDRATLIDICARARSINEFLINLAAAADDCA
ncbi:MAG TPA: hypothetical protein VFU22_28005 [Roseiflexaceae bacterium]|nr:hypothetical protein [Roseiflexaceae bacterium]